MIRVKTAASVAIALFGLGLVGLGAGDAHAGIIVTVGKPSPEPCREKQSLFKRPSELERRIFHSDGTRCIELPNGGVECGKSIRVESVQALPRDWRCVAVAPGLLWCETPTSLLSPAGSGPAAAAGGDFDPTRYESTPATQTPLLDSDPDLLAVGCGAGGLSNLFLVLGALPLLWLRRR